PNCLRLLRDEVSYLRRMSREVPMAQGIYYEVDGRISGPVTFIQLQLLASSGMLQPHHRVRKEESDHWFPARQVKGLFSPAEVAATTAQAAPEAPPGRRRSSGWSSNRSKSPGKRSNFCPTTPLGRWMARSFSG